MKKLSALILLALSILIVSNSTFAEEESTHSFMKAAPVVVSASRLEQPIHEVGSSVAVLSADELLERDVRFVTDALLEVPSLAVTSYGPRGSQVQVRVRGNEANHVLILIDGLRVSSASTGEYDLSNMSLEGIDKIEVLLGPQSTLYGSDAAAGVISITTKKGGKGLGGNIRNTEGALDTRSQSAQLYGGKNGWHYAVGANRYETGGISAASEENGNTEKDGYETHAANAKLGYDSSRVKTWITASKSHSLYNFDGDDFVTGMAVDEPDNQQWVDTRAASWVIEFPAINDRLDNQIQIGNTQYDYESYSVFFGFGSTFMTQTDRDSISYQGSYSFAKNQTLQFGAEKITDNLFVSGFSVFDRSTTQKGIYLHGLTRIGATDVTAGIRSDDFEEFGTHNTYRLTANHHITENWRVRGALGTGFKAPSLQELYDTGAGGNTELKPEESSSIELGVEYRKKNYLTSITAFNQKTSNLIRYVGSFPTGQLLNVDDVNSLGVEFTLQKKIKQFEFDTSITWLDSSEKIGGETRDRLRVPEWAGNVMASYFYPYGRIWAQALYRGDRRNWNWATQEDVIVDEYTLLHIGMNFELTEDATVSGRIDNLTDKKYEEIFSYGTHGRTSSVTVDWRF